MLGKAWETVEFGGVCFKVEQRNGVADGVRCEEVERFLIGALLACFQADRYDPVERKNDEACVRMINC